MRKFLKSILLSILLIAALGIIPNGKLQSTVQAANVKISKSKKTIYEGNTFNLKVTGTDKKVTWTSSNKGVATVNSKGKVTAKKNGKATITAKVGKTKLKCTVNVKLAQFSTYFYSLDEVALAHVNIQKIKTTKSIKYDLDNDGKKDIITIKKINEYGMYEIKLNGKIIDKLGWYADKLYIVDLNKNDKKIDFVISDAAETDLSIYRIYTKVGNKVKNKVLEEVDGGDFKTNNQGMFLFENSLTNRLAPTVFNKYYTVENGNVTTHKNDVNKIKNISIKSNGIGLFYSKNRNVDSDDKSVKELNSKESFNIISFIKNKVGNDNAAYAKLNNGQKVYIFTGFYFI